MSSGGFHSMLETAAAQALRLAPPATPVVDRLWIARQGALAMAGRQSLQTLRRTGAGGDRAALVWMLRPLLCRRTMQRAPADAAAVGNPAKHTIALLSEAAGVAVKLSRGPEAATMLAAEIAAVADPALQAQGLAPRVIDSRSDADEAWLAAEFCRIAHFDGQAAYQRALHDDLMPRVFAAWSARGPVRDTAAALMARLRAGAAAPGLARPLAAAMTRLETLFAAGDFAFPRVATHGDLQPRHMMRAGDGRLRLIDWDVAATRTWTADLLRLAWPKELHGPDWAGGEGFLAPAFRPVLEAGLAWSASAGGDPVGSEGRALLVLGAHVERTIEIAATRGIPFEGQHRAGPALAAMGVSA